MSRRASDTNFDDLYSLKVDNLPYNASVHELRRMFDRYGEIGDVYIPRDRYNQSRGFAFVRFYSKKDADYAADRVDGRSMDGRELRVSTAKYRRPIDEGRGRGDRDRDRRRSRSRSPRRSRSRSPRRSRTRSPPRHSRSPRRNNRRDESRSRSRSRTPRSRSRSRSLSGSRSPQN